MWLLGACLLRLAERDPLAALFAGSVSIPWGSKQPKVGTICILGALGIVRRSLGKLGDSKTLGEAPSCYSAG